MDTPSTPAAPLFNAFMHDLAKQIVPIVIEQIRTQTQAESMGLIALDPNNLSLPVYTLVQNDVAIRDQIRDMIDDAVDSRLTGVERDIRTLERQANETTADVDISDNDDFTDLKSRVGTLEEKVGELEENAGISIDADDSDFSDAVLQVLRNTI
jgi:polyhydroxyalkanoate synthesis regulator phasin